MSEETPVDGSEFILRRVPPDRGPAFRTVKTDHDGTLRPTSVVMSTREGEEGLSCTRKQVTSAASLLSQLSVQQIDSAGWMACEMNVSEITELGLKVIACPTDLDPGHCEIRPGEDCLFSKGIARKIAKKSKIVFGADGIELT